MAPNDTPSPDPAPTPERKGILAFVQNLKAPKPDAAATSKPSTLTEPFTDKGQLYHHFAEFSWTLQQNNWLRISFIVHVALATLIWGGGYLAITRPTYLQIGAPTLKESAEAFYGTDYTTVDPKLTLDQMSFFTISALALLHQLDAYSTPPMPLLRGMVDPSIIEKAQKRYDKNAKLIQQQKFVQNLVINRILNPITNPQTGTVAVFVEGYFAMLLQDENGDPVNRIEPYRGKAILRFTPVSELNPFPFTLEDLTEVVGKAEAAKWDSETEKFFKK